MGSSVNEDMGGELSTARLARALFARYNEHRMQDGLPVEYERFEDQPSDLQESCRAQAASFNEKARAIGLSIEPAGSAGASVGALDPADVERLARAEHDRWVHERLSAGWSYGPVKDVGAKRSPFLIPYDELPEDMKEYDREPVREMPALLREAGFVLVRRE